jgi:hypothetical protein
MLCRDVLALLSKCLKGGISISEVVVLTKSGYVSYAPGTLPINTSVLEEYLCMREAVDELINKRLSLPTMNARRQRISYEVQLPIPTMCVVMLACPNYVVSSSTISGVDDMYFAQFWKALYLASINVSDAAVWISSKMAGRNRMTFCVIRGIPIAEGRTSDEYQYMNPPAEVLDDIVGNVAVLNKHSCDELTSQLACGTSRSYYAVLRRIEYHAIKTWRG